MVAAILWNNDREGCRTGRRVVATVVAGVAVMLVAGVGACGPDGDRSGMSRSPSRAQDDLLGDGDLVLDASAPARRAAASDLEDGRWSVLLGTFSGVGYRERAEAFARDVARRFPALGSPFLEGRGEGVMVVVGRFEGPGDADAQDTLGLAKAISTEGRRPFATAMLVRRTAAADAGPPKPHDLRTLRATAPGRRDLYTLQIAVWSTLGTDEISPARVRREAESMAARLRAQGVEAWFHHDADSETSTVTVGGFGSDAYDSRSTLYAPEVERLMRRFPTQLVNGEELLVRVDPGNPQSRMRPLGPRLVEVPFD